MYVPDCDNCEYRADCVVWKANKEMRETLWNIGREQSGRHDYFLNGQYYKAVDVVARDCYDKILAENDIMREQLAQIGKKPSDCMDDVKPIPRGEWIKNFTSFHTLWGANCSNCNGWVDPGNTNINRLYRYCPHCGSLNGEGINSDF